MLTPQEVSERAFAKSSFGGYHMAQVDEFLDVLTGDYSALYNENAVLKSKMKVLVDKVEEYRATEDAMRRALHSAQKMAEEMVKEGEAKKQAAIEEAVAEVKRQSEETRAAMAQEEAQVQAQLEGVKTALANEQTRLDAAKASTAAYIAQLKELYTNELKYIGSLSELTAEQAAQPEAPAEEAPASAPAEEAQVEVAQEEEAAEVPVLEPVGETRVFDQVPFTQDEE